MFYFARLLKISFQKMKSLKIDQWLFGCDDFLGEFKGKQRESILPKRKI